MFRKSKLLMVTTTLAIGTMPACIAEDSVDGAQVRADISLEPIEAEEPKLQPGSPPLPERLDLTASSTSSKPTRVTANLGGYYRLAAHQERELPAKPMTTDEQLKQNADGITEQLQKSWARAQCKKEQGVEISFRTDSHGNMFDIRVHTSVGHSRANGSPMHFHESLISLSANTDWPRLSEEEMAAAKAVRNMVPKQDFKGTPGHIYTFHSSFSEYGVTTRCVATDSSTPAIDRILHHYWRQEIPSNRY